MTSEPPSITSASVSANCSIDRSKRRSSAIHLPLCNGYLQSELFLSSGLLGEDTAIGLPCLVESQAHKLLYPPAQFLLNVPNKAVFTRRVQRIEAQKWLRA